LAPEIPLKSPVEIEAMAMAARDLVEVFLALRDDRVKPGIRTRELDEYIEGMILAQGNIPAFKGYNGFPASSCISVNNQVVHGIPGDRLIEEGDIVGIDIGLVRQGWFADSAETMCVGEVRPEARMLCSTTRRGLQAGIEAARVGNRVSDVGRAIVKVAGREGFGVVETLVGHGIGRQLHEAPQVPNFESRNHPDHDLVVGMVLALEPMFNLGTRAVRLEPDEWTVVTVDGGLSAHFEHTVAITEDGPQVLTAR
jgi:methionyl aminopeptidase